MISLYMLSGVAYHNLNYVAPSMTPPCLAGDFASGTQITSL